MKKKLRNIIIIFIFLLIILLFSPLLMGAYFSPWINTEYLNIELNNIPIYSQIWIENYNELNSKYKEYYFNDSLILTSVLNSYNNKYDLYIDTYSRNYNKAEYYINEYRIISKNIIYDNKIYDEPIIIPEELIKINNSPFDGKFKIGNYYFKDQIITIIINITIKRYDNIETKELEYNFKRKTTFCIYKSVF